MRLKGIYLAFFVLHFLLIISVSCRDIVWLVAHKLTILPSSFAAAAERLESVVAEQSPIASNPFRYALSTYLHITGIDRGYGYFAPNIPGGYRLVFELHYPDDRIEYELPGVNSDAAGLRVATLLDEIGRTRSDALREYMVKTLAESVYREHLDATSVRAVLGATVLPSLNEFEQGKRISYDFLYAYDFSRAEDANGSRKP